MSRFFFQRFVDEDKKRNWKNYGDLTTRYRDQRGEKLERNAKSQALNEGEAHSQRYDHDECDQPYTDSPQKPH